MISIALAGSPLKDLRPLLQSGQAPSTASRPIPTPCSAASGGQGFRQLMQTFEAARIQTGRSRQRRGLARLRSRMPLQSPSESKFGKPIVEFPRVADKLAMMGRRDRMARDWTHFSAEEKEKGDRCDRTRLVSRAQ